MENKQDILKRLASPDMTVVAAAIDEIKENGDLSIVPELLEILLHNEDTTVVTHVTSLLSDIRDTGFKTILVTLELVWFIVFIKGIIIICPIAFK